MRAVNRQERSALMPRKFKIGQLVRYRLPSHRPAVPTGKYQITGFIPQDQTNEPKYRIKHLNEGEDRIAKESELRST
jgi:hypothetical protein